VWTSEPYSGILGILLFDEDEGGWGGGFVRYGNWVLVKIPRPRGVLSLA
jgi:hypothetical protein